MTKKQRQAVFRKLLKAMLRHLEREREAEYIRILEEGEAYESGQTY